MKKWPRIVVYIVLAIVAAGIAAPYLDAEGYRGRIQQALERALGRPVDVGKVHFNLFTGPGFTVDDVTIHEDPKIGIEPLAYVEELEARVRLTSFWTRRLSFSNLRLTNPDINITKGADGVWNFQELMQRAESPVGGNVGDFPSIQVRSGRISFKFGDYKSVFYLSDADVDVDPLDRDRLDIRFAGQPSRTDQAAQYFGQLLGRGIWQRGRDQDGHLDFHVELERSAISEVLKLIEGHGVGVHGIVASRAHIVGPVADLQVTGDLELDDIHRWDMFPQGGGWRLNYRGNLDLWSHNLSVSTDPTDNPGMPVMVRFRATDYLGDPHWTATAEFHDAPAGDFIAVARHMGAQLPDGIAIDGKVDGAIGYSRPGGMQGQLTMRNSSVAIPGVSPVKFRSANVTVDGDRIQIGPSVVEAANDQTAELEANYSMATNALDLKISTHGLGISELQSSSGRLFGTASIPVLEECRQGTWKGWVRYQNAGEGDGAWTGDFDVQNARIDLPGLAEPLHITAASVTVDGRRAALTKMRGRAGNIRFAGDFRHDPAGTHGNHLRIEIPKASLADIQKMLMPTLSRPESLLARFRLSSAHVPEWLKNRRIEGPLLVDSLTAGDESWRFASRLAWDGTTIRFNGVEAGNRDSEASGQVAINLAGMTPRFRLTGQIADVDYKSGLLTLAGVINTRGVGTDLIANAVAKGTFSGENILFAPDAEFRTISGNFDWTPDTHLQLTAIEASQGLDRYSGQGLLQDDGKLLLDLSTAHRSVRFTGTVR
jgi:AsmA family